MKATEKQISASKWFCDLRDKICAEYEKIEQEYGQINKVIPGKFERKTWSRDCGGGGEISIMRGNVFEKVGVNVSTVQGEFSKEFREKIPGAEENPEFFATGISLVSHMQSPLIPAAHFNTRYIETQKTWFGGGGDLTPIYPESEETEIFHSAFQKACDKHNLEYYKKFKQDCDDYFFLKHRGEPRGVGGIFYDYLNTGDFIKDFALTQDIGLAMHNVYPEIIRKKMMLTWTQEQREYQLLKRGRYVEFNLLYDRGTAFGLATGGNVEAILMSMPPVVKW